MSDDAVINVKNASCDHAWHATATNPALTTSHVSADLDYGIMGF